MSDYIGINGQWNGQLVTKVLTSRVLINSGGGRFGLFGGVLEDWLTLPYQIGCMETDEYPYLTQLSAPDRLRLAAYEACDRGVPSIHLRAILDAEEELEMLARMVTVELFPYSITPME